MLLFAQFHKIPKTKRLSKNNFKSILSCLVIICHDFIPSGRGGGGGGGTGVA